MQIRTPNINEIENICDLLCQLGYKQSLESFKDTLNLYLQSPSYGILIAVENEIIKGLIAYSSSIMFVRGKTRFWIEALVVDSAYRKQGIGKTLLKQMENIASGAAPSIIDLVSGISRADTGTYDFYRKMGYELSGNSRKTYFRKEII